MWPRFLPGLESRLPPRSLISSHSVQSPDSSLRLPPLSHWPLCRPDRPDGLLSGRLSAAASIALTESHGLVARIAVAGRQNESEPVALLAMNDCPASNPPYRSRTAGKIAPSLTGSATGESTAIQSPAGSMPCRCRSRIDASRRIARTPSVSPIPDSIRLATTTLVSRVSSLAATSCLSLSMSVPW